MGLILKSILNNLDKKVGITLNDGNLVSGVLIACESGADNDCGITTIYVEKQTLNKKNTFVEIPITQIKSVLPLKD